MIFVQTIKDRYAGSSDLAKKDQSGTGKDGEPFIRRPTNGIQIKDDTFATIRVVAADSGGNKLLVDAGSKRRDSEGKFLKIGEKQATDIYSNFLLQQVQEERQEKQQILETFGEAYIFFFGERARVISFSGILANTFDFNWESEWWHNYENYLRGTKCVENDARVYISYDNTLVGGYVLSTSSAKDTMNKNHVSFQFQLFVTYYSNFSSIGDPSAYNGLPDLNDIDLTREELKQYRPTLLPSKIPLTTGGVLAQLGGKPPTLFAALEEGFTKVKDTWSKIDQVVNNTISSVQGLLDGGVRVPVGFAGSSVFNDEVSLPTPEELASNFDKGHDGRIHFTTFSDNTEEYVGVGTQYGTNSWEAGVQRFSFGKNLSADEELTYDQRMADEAIDLWAVGGKFIVPPVELGPVSKFLVSKTLGLVAVGATKAWQGASTALQAGSADKAGFASDLAHAAIAVGASAPPLPSF